MSERSFLDALRRDYRQVVDETPCSEFVRVAREVNRRQLAARTKRERAAADAELAAVFRRYFGPGGPARGTVDGKTAACGRDE